MVVKGYSQVECLDFVYTFSLVEKLSTDRILHAITSINNLYLHQLDVNNAFLHGDLEDDYYMLVPQRVSCSKSNQVCKLVKSLYGLRQTSRKWYENLLLCFKKIGYVQSNVD